MGRYYGNKKEEADSLKKIQVWWIKKYGYLSGFGNSGTIKWTHGWSGQESSIGIQTSLWGDDKYLRIYYTQTDSEGNKREFDYKITLLTTPCNYGGQRYWFICSTSKNGVYCGRRVSVLYKAGDYFACRHCYDLSYESRNENKRYKHYPLFASLLGYQKAEELEDQIKRRYYAGKPTRKQRKLDKIYARVGVYNRILRETGEI